MKLLQHAREAKDLAPMAGPFLRREKNPVDESNLDVEVALKKPMVPKAGSNVSVSTFTMSQGRLGSHVKYEQDHLFGP